VEYLVVSSRTPAEGKLGVGARKKEEFPWLNRDSLSKIFPDTHVERLRIAMLKAN
jgi:hypothetical protein